VAGIPVLVDPWKAFGNMQSAKANAFTKLFILNVLSQQASLRIGPRPKPETLEEKFGAGPRLKGVLTLRNTSEEFNANQ
jgi:hypothetical protein